MNDVAKEETRVESELDVLRRCVAALARENSDLRARMDAVESAFRRLAFPETVDILPSTI